MATPPDTISPDQFRANFPEFSDTTKYPDSVVGMWLSIAGLMLFTGRWPTTVGANGESMYDIGTKLFVAHNLSLGLQAQQRAALGGPPGIQTGALASVATGGASVTYDPSIGVNKDAGWASFWNLTTYGVQFMWLCQMIGAGPIILGVGTPPPFSMAATGAFAGPWVFNFPNPSGSG